MADISDSRWMQYALSLAARGVGETAPNPSVGCVIVKNGHLVGMGRTAATGRPHAERVALEMARGQTEGATAYVTLEPCSHHGKSPPCADALIEAGLKRIVIALIDPDKRVNGNGIEKLKAAGISVEVGLCSEKARETHLGFLLSKTENRPFLTLKLATTLDGKIATKTGESQWITSPESRRLVHLERAQHDAVMIGSGTAQYDDPMLNIRGIGLEHRLPLRVVIDSHLSLPLTSKLAQTAKTHPVLLIHSRTAQKERISAWQQLSAHTKIANQTPENCLDLKDTMQLLAEAGITRVFCEGGGRLAANLLQNGLVDRLLHFQAGKIIGNDGIPAIANLGITALGNAVRLKKISAREIGPDLLCEWRRA